MKKGPIFGHAKDELPNLYYTYFMQKLGLQVYGLPSDENQIKQILAGSEISHLELNIVEKSDLQRFEKFLDKLYSVGVHELKIVENFVIQNNEEFEVEETENTISILNRYIDESDMDCDKSVVKGILQKIYSEACEVE